MRKVILFGASVLGQKAFHDLKNEYDIVSFCDNNKDLWGTTFCGIPVVDPRIMRNYFITEDILVVIASMYVQEITKQLLELGIENIRVFQGFQVLDKQGVLTENESKKYKDKIYNISECRNRICFFIENEDDKFINDIIDYFSSKYQVRKIFPKKAEDINKNMEWADICWFEWCSRFLVYASNLELAKTKYIITRLHRFEAFTDYLKNICFDNIDNLIFVSSFLKKFVQEKYKIREEKVSVIFNGIKSEKFPAQVHNKGKKIACLGYINIRKNPIMLLQNFYQLLKLDKEYELFFAGSYTEEKEFEALQIYINCIIDKLGITDKVHFDGFIKNNDLFEWLEDKDYIITGSYSEGHPVGIMEAMSCGIKPVVHYFPGIEEFYPEKYIYYSLDEFLNIITEDTYDSMEYTSFIKNNFSFDEQILKLEKLMEEIKNKFERTNIRMLEIDM